MVVAGVTAKSTPLALVPKEVPPDDWVYQLILFPAEVAFKFDVALIQTVDGVAVTEVGTEGNAETVTVAVTALVQLFAFE